MSTEFAHRRRIFTVASPTLGDALALWMDPAWRAEEYDQILDTAEIRRFVSWGDGESIDAELARGVRQDPESWRAYRAARNAELVAAADGFTLVARCPGCREWEAELSPLALAVCVRSAYWPVFDERDRLSVPAFALGAVDRTLSHVAPAAALSVRLAQRPGSGIVLSGDPCARFEDWRKVGEELAQSPALARDWVEDSPGWTALLHLACVAPSIAGQGRATTDNLLALADLPLSEFLALDNAYALTHLVEVPEDNSARLDCPRCGAAFAPLAPSVSWPG